MPGTWVSLVGRSVGRLFARLYNDRRPFTCSSSTSGSSGKKPTHLAFISFCESLKLVQKMETVHSVTGAGSTPTPTLDNGPEIVQLLRLLQHKMQVKGSTTTHSISNKQRQQQTNPVEPKKRNNKRLNVIRQQHARQTNEQARAGA